MKDFIFGLQREVKRLQVSLSSGQDFVRPWKIVEYWGWMDNLAVAELMKLYVWLISRNLLVCVLLVSGSGQRIQSADYSSRWHSWGRTSNRITAQAGSIKEKKLQLGESIVAASEKDLSWVSTYLKENTGEALEVGLRRVGISYTIQ